MKKFLVLALFLCYMSLVAGERKALVIGNANYSDSALRNPINDANLMATALRDLGFKVSIITDADQQTMDNGINSFVASLDYLDEAVFYYSGHGANSGGENYLIPTGRVLTDESELKYYAVSSNLALEKLQKARISVMILDACRDNPFKGVRSGNKGLAIMSGKAGSQYIIYSTEQGKTAADGTGFNSPFTVTFVKHLTSGDKITDMMQKVTREVKNLTYDKQVPWTAGNLIDDFYFSKPGAATDITILVEPSKQFNADLAAEPASKPKLIDVSPADIHPREKDKLKGSHKTRLFVVQVSAGLSIVNNNGGAPAVNVGIEFMLKKKNFKYGMGIEYETDPQVVEWRDSNELYEYFYRHIPVYASVKYAHRLSSLTILEGIAHIGVSFADIDAASYGYGDFEKYSADYYFGIGAGVAFKERIIIQALYKENHHSVSYTSSSNKVSSPQYALSAGYRF